MNFKKAILMGVGAYFATAILGIIATLALGVDFSGGTEVPLLLWYISFALLIIVGFGFAYWYFKKEKATTKDGFYLGLIFMGVGFVGDFLFFIPYVFSGGSFGELLSYYQDINFLVSVVLFVGVTTLVAYLKETKKLK